jgi:hypothetical protein
MHRMRRLFAVLLAGLGLVLALPSGSFGKLTEVGLLTETTPPSVPSCPTPTCLAVSRTTGYQVRVGSTRNPVFVPRDGVIVAWTISLGKPTSTQVKFFNANEGGNASAGIAILRPNRGRKAPHYSLKLVSQSPLVQLQPYFGTTAQFPLESTLPVKKGDVVALTVPTWAPALALGFSKGTSWRASRPSKQCSVTNAQTAHTKTGSTVQYYCMYETARLTYSATEISTP